MFMFRASQVTAPLAMAAFALVVTFTNGALLPNSAHAAKKKVVDTTSSIFRCTHEDGITEYSDIRCKNAMKVDRWKSERIAPGITAGPKGTVDLHEKQPPAIQQRDDPFVTCRKLGGKYFVAAKLCKLPQQAKIQIYVP